ncbi:UTR4 Enolase-phosphatase E1 [Candida maltosa Xu316]|uniref:Enolase-phosphatase E1 n=1 Tax=Candida maltosa (strain Xu316) TaxID=1245528 RepID=M3K799_CANMX|nr:Enolase-phosphatase E1 [Candida maltosa Xu316]
MAIDTLILDIEGTVCPITFVKDELFPYFIEKLPSFLSQITFPISTTTTSTNPIIPILQKLPESITTSSETVFSHFKSLVDQDIKDPILKSIQGIVWKLGYENGDLSAPIYTDAISFIDNYPTTTLDKKIYIYSSGSVNAQKLLFGHVRKENGVVDLNSKLSGYFDITTSGYKNQSSSYVNILKDINKEGSQVLFLSDNVHEVEAAIQAGMESYVVVRPGNAALTDDEKEKYKLIYSFDELDL